MKIRNPLMVAYIIFIILCSLFKAYIELVFWYKLLAAITCTSTLLAISEEFKMVSRGYDEILHVVYEVDSKFDKLKSSRDVLEKKIKLSELVTSERIEHTIFTKVLGGFESCNQFWLGQRAKFENIKLQKNRMENIAIFIQIIAFIVFFCIIAFEMLQYIVVPLQDDLTILAFIILLFTQYIQDGIEEHFKIIRRDIGDIGKNIDEIYNQMKNL